MPKVRWNDGVGLYANDVFIEPTVEVLKSPKLEPQFPAVLDCPDQHPTSGLSMHMLMPKPQPGGQPDLSHKAARGRFASGSTGTSLPA